MMDDVGTYLAAAEVTAALLADPAVERNWDKPSALTGMRVAGVAGHLARSVVLTEPFLDEPTAEGEPLSTVEYYLTGDEPTDFDSRTSRRIRESGEETAAVGPGALIGAVDEALGRLRHRLPGEDLGTTRRWFGRLTTTRTVLQARTLEMVVHIDDLAVSVDVPTPSLPPSALEMSIRLLVDMARGRHGDLAVVRALTRRERDTNQALRVM